MIAKESALTDIVEAIVNRVLDAASSGKGYDEQRGIIKHFLFDESLIPKSQRPKALKEINTLLDVNWSMTAIRKSATVEISSSQPVKPEPEVFSGSVEVPTGIIATEESAKEKIVMDTTQAVEVVTAQPAVEVQVAPVIAEQAPVIEQPVVTAPEQSTTIAQSVTTEATDMSQISVTAQDAAAVATAAVDTFYTYLGTDGVTGRKEFQEYLAANKDFAERYQTAISLYGALTDDEKFMLWTENNPKDLQAFSMHIAEKTKNKSGTLTGKRDSGVGSKWVGLAGALIGGGLEMFARGEISVVKGIGTLAGAAGAYFLGDVIDEKVENEYVRYAIAGSVGMALGAGASTVAGAAKGMFASVVEEAPVQAPAPIVSTTGNGTVAGL